MTKKTRLIALLICVTLFLILTPYVITRSLGYMIDFKKFKLVATGGIYLKVLPSGASITIDSKIKGKNSAWSNSFLKQNLLPEKHEILIKRGGYHDYQKFLNVKEGEVTKLEHIVLFKQNIPFDLLEDDVEKFAMSPDGNYLLLSRNNGGKTDFTILKIADYEKKIFSIPATKNNLPTVIWSDISDKMIITGGNSHFLAEPFESEIITSLSFLENAKEISFNPANSDEIFFVKSKNLYSNKQSSPIAENVISYHATDKSIIWFSYDGFFYTYSVTGRTTEKISFQVFPINGNNLYKIMVFGEAVFLWENDALFLLNQNTKVIEKFYDSAKPVKISPDKQKVLFFNNHEILYYFLNSNNEYKIFLNRFSEKIEDCQWLNDNYIIINFGNKIAISETDIRGNINIIYFPQELSVDNQSTINLNNAEIFFNQTEGKLYISTENTLIVSEKLTP